MVSPVALPEPPPQPCDTCKAPKAFSLPSLGRAHPTQGRHSAGSSPAQGAVYPLSGSPEQLGWEAVAEQRHLVQEGVVGGYSLDETKGTVVVGKGTHLPPGAV